MQTLIDPENFVGLRGMATPDPDDDFLQEFEGLCIGTRNGFLQVRDADNDVFEIETSQFTPNKA
jgi:hypothetical protein